MTNISSSNEVPDKHVSILTLLTVFKAAIR